MSSRCKVMSHVSQLFDSQQRRDNVLAKPVVD
uniref:Uncharacterized protein n=1 Tax=Anguilla anguilla TaxID=7936 RepID=A0A0E9RC24_ANGAN